MRTVLVPPGSVVGRPERGAGMPRPTIRNGTFDDGIDGWGRRGTPFRVVTLENRRYVSSYVPLGPGEPNGEGAQGALYQDFDLDDQATTLCFRVHGGGVLTPGDFQTRNVASVRLYHGNEIVRESFGWNSDAYQDVRWNIREFAGERLRLDDRRQRDRTLGLHRRHGLPPGGRQLRARSLRGAGTGRGSTRRSGRPPAGARRRPGAGARPGGP